MLSKMGMPGGSAVDLTRHAVYLWSEGVLLCGNAGEGESC